jgi:hypothetical protein
VAHAVAVFGEYDDGRVRSAVGIFGVNVARERRTVV